MTARMRLRRGDGQVYLERWGFEWDRVGGVFIHRMSAPDVGVDLHNHPWVFGSLILWGGYIEEREHVEYASKRAWVVEHLFPHAHRGWPSRRGWLSWKVMPLCECHRITRLLKRTSWTLVIRGPWKRDWGFFEPDGFVAQTQYKTLRREMWEEIPNANT